jgi:hypothetical protein
MSSTSIRWSLSTSTAPATIKSDDSCTRAYSLDNIHNVIADHGVTYGMRPGRIF